MAEAPLDPAPIDFRSIRLHVVSGKGGTGKTTVAASLAIALATGGHNVLLVEVEGRQGIAQVFDSPPLSYGEQRIAGAPGGGSVYALAVDPEAAMLEYLELFYNVKRGGALLKRAGAVDFATTIAPGLRDVLLTGKTGESVRRKVGGRYIYSAVVLDAPPTGRISRFLNANAEVSELARVGPIKNQADLVMGVIRSPATAVHMVSLLEEMPVQETIEGMAELAANDLPVGAIVINMSRPPLTDQITEEDLAVVTDEQIGQSIRAAGLAGLADDPGAIAGLRAEYDDYLVRRELERTERTKLLAANRPILELPWVAEGVDVGTLYAFGAALIEGGVR